MRKLFFGFLVAALAGLLVGSPAAGKVKKNAPIKIGAVLPLTGELAVFGQMQKNAYQMALKRINDAGGVKGRKLKLLIEDDKGEPKVGRSAAEKTDFTESHRRPHRRIFLRGIKRYGFGSSTTQHTLLCAHRSSRQYH